MFQGGWTALIWSSYCGYTNLTNLLLDRGADINAHGNFHITALVWAAGRGHTKLACNLIGRGAKVNVGDKVCIKTMLTFFFIKLNHTFFEHYSMELLH